MIHGLTLLRIQPTRIRIQHKPCIHQLPMVLHQPIHPIRLATLLVRGKRQNDIAIRHKPLPLQPDKCRHRSRIRLLHILRPPPVEVPFLLRKHKGIRRPILPLRLHNIEMPDDQHRLLRAPGPAAIPRHHIAFALIRPQHHNVLRRKPRIQQPLPHRLRRNCRTPHRIRRIDLNQLLEDFMRQLPRSRIQRGHLLSMDSRSKKSCSTATAGNSFKVWNLLKMVSRCQSGSR